MGKSQTVSVFTLRSLRPGDLLLVSVVHIFDDGIEQEIESWGILCALP